MTGAYLEEYVDQFLIVMGGAVGKLDSTIMGSRTAGYHPERAIGRRCLG